MLLFDSRGVALLLLHVNSPCLKRLLCRDLLLCILVLQLHKSVIEPGDAGGALVKVLLDLLLVGVAWLAQRADDPQLLDLAGQR